MTYHKCFEEIKTNLSVDLETTFPILWNFTNEKSGYGLRVVQKLPTNNGGVKYRKTFVEMNYCPICGAKLEGEEG